MAVRAISLDPPFRPAVPDDAPALVDFIDYASAGMALIAWAQAVGPGSGDPRAFGLATVRGEASSMSYRNAVVVDDGDGPIAALISHPLPAEPQPIPAGPPGLTNPWQELRNDACGAWHIGVLAAYPAHRGRGLGTALVGIADALRAAHGAPRLSLLVADANTRGRHLYERLDFRERARRPMTQGAWTNPGKDWLLLVRDA